MKNWLAITFSIISFVSLSELPVCAQSDQGGPPENGPPPDFQNQPGGPGMQGNETPPGGPPGGGYRDRFGAARARWFW